MCGVTIIGLGQQTLYAYAELRKAARQQIIVNMAKFRRADIIDDIIYSDYGEVMWSHTKVIIKGWLVTS